MQYTVVRGRFDSYHPLFRIIQGVIHMKYILPLDGNKLVFQPNDEPDARSFFVYVETETQDREYLGRLDEKDLRKFFEWCKGWILP